MFQQQINLGVFFSPTCVLLLLMLQWHSEICVWSCCEAETVHDRAFATKDVSQTKQRRWIKEGQKIQRADRGT